MSSTVFAYPLDPTGQNPANRVEGEIHALAPKRVRAIIPRYGPYYTKNLVVYDDESGRVLTRQTQYRCAELLQDATLNYGQEICALILITDPTVSNSVRIDYNVVGGLYMNDVSVLANLYEAVVNDARPVDWQNVEDKPLAYPPTIHRHVLSDVYGWEPIVSALERLRSAIVLGNVPAFEALLDWVDERLKNYEIKLNADFTSYMSDLNSRYTQYKQDMSGRYDGFIRDLNAKYTQIVLHTENKSNPHTVDATQVGLGQVADLPIVTLDEVKLGVPVNKYLTHEMFIAAVAAMGGIGGGSGGGGSTSATYSIAHEVAIISEGYSVDFKVTTHAVADHTVLYWTIVYLGTNAADFSSIAGVFTIMSNQGAFSVAISTDRIIETNESFAVQIHVDSPTGTVVATSSMVAITDVPPYIPPERPVTEVMYLKHLYDIAIPADAGHYYLIQQEDKLGRHKKLTTRQQREGSGIVLPPVIDWPDSKVVGLESPYLTGEVTSKSIYLAQPLERKGVATVGRYSDKAEKRALRAGSGIVYHAPVVLDKNAVLTMQADSLYAGHVDIASASYYWVGNVGRRITHEGSGIVYHAPVILDKNAVLTMQAESLYDAHTDITSASYYWVGNVGRRLMHEGSGIVYHPPVTPPVVTPTVTVDRYADACCLYDPQVRRSAATYYIVGRIGLRHSS